MTVKQFFKSTTFKCIVTLLAILLVCGIFLTVAYGFLEVTEEERLDRAISKIYGKQVTSETVLKSSDANVTLGEATIIEAHYIKDDGNYLVKAKAKGGFNGTVTCWVLVTTADNLVSGVNKVISEGSDGETFLGDINYLDKFAETEYTDGFLFTTDNGFKTAGASKSSTAINNSVNGAVSYVKSVLDGGNANE